jgi:tryptophan synthase alpha chain
MTTAPANRIDQTFAALHTAGKKGLLPYVTAGLPDLDTTLRVLESLAELGVTAVELGFPYSDPIADGPIIQASFTRALERNIRVREILAMVRRFRRQHALPILGMLSYSIVHRIGIERFIQEAADAGIDGLILPDLSLEEAPQTAEQVANAGMKMPMLVSPVSPAERRRRIAEISTGFVYYMSVAGITGERRQLPPELVDNVRQLRQIARQPVVVGFGISTPEQVRLVCSEADGAIIGSALVRRIMETLDGGGAADQVIATVRAAVTDWLGGLP